MTNDQPATLDLFDPRFIANPHPGYAEHRETDPVRRVTMADGVQAWLVTGYEEAKAALSDERLGVTPALGRRAMAVGDHPLYTQEASVLMQSMMHSDPPNHTRLRKLVSNVFTSSRVERLKPTIQNLADRLLDDITPAGRADLVAQYALPLPTTVICNLLGLPHDDQAQIRDWFLAILAPPTSGLTEAAGIAFAELIGYINHHIDDKRRHPGDDLISALASSRDDNSTGLSDSELISTISILASAGYQTTADLIANALHTLLTHPDQLRRLQDKPDLIGTAIDEFLRYEGSVETATLRFATQELILGHHTIQPGDAVLVSLLGANRDPNRFPDPDHVDLTRSDNAHLAFGHGIHFCIGRHLALAEARIALTTALTRLPALTLAAPPHELPWKPGPIFRGLASLPVTYTPTWGLAAKYANPSIQPRPH